MDLGKLTQQLSDTSPAKKMPPVEQWDPPFCGDMNLVIKRNGQWWHEGTPFTRAKLIKLLSSVLKKEGDDYFLVTPVEKIGIQVEDVPFLIINDEITDKGIRVSTQTGDTVLLGPNHQVELREFEGNLVPYCLIRRNLWARLHQNVLYRWVEQADEKRKGNTTVLSMQSGDYEFCIGEFTV
jgi:hypothetical protein